MATNINARRARWVAPVAILATAGAIAGGVALAGEDSPDLPAKDAAELLTDIQSAEFGPFSGTVVQTSRLGLPELPGLTGDGAEVSPLRMLTGSNTARMWFSSAEQFRFSLMGAYDEVTLIRDGADVWLWSSETNEADHVALPGALPLPGPGESGSPHPDPQASAQRFLDAVEPSTEVAVTGTVQVADRSAYELTIRPKAEDSLVEEVAIAVDSETSRVLRTEVIADGMTEPAFEVGFTSVSFDEPSDEVYRFNPPPGADVAEHNIAELAGSIMNLGRGGFAPDGGAGHQMGSAPTVIGEGWTSVIVLDDVPMPGTDGERSGEDGERSGEDGERSGEDGERSGEDGERSGMDGGAALDALLGSAEQVSGGYGSGHLFTTSLLSALWLDDGTLLLGAVTPDVLEDAASEVAR